MSIVDKVALITGGVSGIGLSLAKELLKNEAKAVALVDINDNLGEQVLEDICYNFGKNRAIFIKADVSKDKELEDAFVKTVEKFNQLDLVFNNAGICDERNFQKLVQINLGAVLSGTFLAMTKYLPKYKKGSEGIIVNMASISGLEPIPFIPGYSASKSGVVNLGRSFGHKAFYDKYQVKVFTICPGIVATPMTLRFDHNVQQLVLLPDPDKGAEYKKMYMKQYETPERIAQKTLEIIKMGNSGSVWEIQKNQRLKKIIF